MSHAVGEVKLELLRGGEDAGLRLRDGPGAPQISQRVRIVDAALECISRQGVAKTTLDDVAQEAGCSRATVYRTFPGGKEAVLAAAVDTEVSRLFSAMAVRMGAAHDVEDVLVAGMTEASTRIGHNAALSRLLEHEPEVVLPHLAFAHMDSVLAACSGFAAPFLGRWLDHEEALRVAEWAARIVLSYLACPAEGVDLIDPESVRHVVRSFVLPGVRFARSDKSPSHPGKGEAS